MQLYDKNVLLITVKFVFCYEFLVLCHLSLLACAKRLTIVHACGWMQARFPQVVFLSSVRIKKYMHDLRKSRPMPRDFPISKFLNGPTFSFYRSIPAYIIDTVSICNMYSYVLQCNNLIRKYAVISVLLVFRFTGTSVVFHSYFPIYICIVLYYAHHRKNKLCN